jgi:hypothetical protein
MENCICPIQLHAQRCGGGPSVQSCTTSPRSGEPRPTWVTIHGCHIYSSTAITLLWCGFPPPERSIVNSAGQEIPWFIEAQGSWPCTRKPATGPVLDQMNPVSIVTSYLCKLYFNTRIALQFARRFPWGFSIKVFYAFAISPAVLHNYVCNTWKRVHIMKLFSMQFSSASWYINFLPKHPQSVVLR